MLHDPAQVRAGFEQGAHTFLETMRAIDDGDWDKFGALGDWNVRQLAAHAMRAFVTVDGYLSAPPTVDRVIPDAVEYYRIVLNDPTVHQGVSARAKQASRQIIDPLGEAEAVVARVLGVVAGSGDDDRVNTFAGSMTLIEYLATRVVEIGVHTLDLQRATRQHPSLHPDTSAVVLSVLTELASPVSLILALTGRESLPDGHNVLQ